MLNLAIALVLIGLAALFVALMLVALILGGIVAIGEMGTEIEYNENHKDLDEDNVKIRKNR